MRNDQASWHDVEVHDGLGEQQRGGGRQQAEPMGGEVAEHAGDAGRDHVVGGQALMLVGGGHQGGAGGPKGVEDHHQQQYREQAAAGGDMSVGPVAEEPGAEEHHGHHNQHSDDEGELAGAAVQGSGKRDVAGPEGDGHLGLEGAVDHLDHLECDAGDGTGGTEDDDVDRSERVADSQNGALQVERVADGEGHEGDGGAGKLADLGIAGMLPAVFDPGDVALDHDAEDDGEEDVGCGEDEGGGTGAAMEGDGDHHGGKGNQGEGALDHGAEGVATDGAIGGLEELLQLAEQDGDAEVEDDPLGIGLGDLGEVKEARGGEEVEGSAEQGNGGRADADDEPPAGLEDSQGAGAVAAGDEHGHLVAGDGAEAAIGEGEPGGDGVDDDPVAVERDAPEVEEYWNLDELDDGIGEAADPAGDKAEE